MIPGVTVGQSFDPRYERCGFYPADIVDRQRGIGDGPKRVYRRLVAFMGDAGCFPLQATLASVLGKCEREIWDDLHELQRLRLLAIRKRGHWPGLIRANCYEFLWHEMFESEPQTVAGHSAKVNRNPEKVSRKKSPSEPQTVAGVSCTPVTPVEDERTINQPQNGKNRHSAPEPRSRPSQDSFPKEDRELIEAALRDYMDRAWGCPDSELVAKVLEAGHGAGALRIVELLVALRRDGCGPSTSRGPRKSWGWFPRVVGDHFSRYPDAGSPSGQRQPERDAEKFTASFDTLDESEAAGPGAGSSAPEGGR